MTDIWRISL